MNCPRCKTGRLSAWIAFAIHRMGGLLRGCTACNYSEFRRIG